MDKEMDHLLPLSSDECGGSGGEPDSDEDIVTDYHQTYQQGEGTHPAMLPTTTTPRPPSGPLPTISVTPHSPAAAPRTYAVLEDSLQQVRELHESVQLMRNASATPAQTSREFAALALNPLLAQMARLSASCPALNEAGAQEPEAFGGSLGSSPLHQPHSRKGSGAHDWLTQPEPQRRKSWTALEDLSNTGKMKHGRQRSISLSSMESEADESSLIDNVDGSTVRLLGPDAAPLIIRHRTRTATGGASTHSLNEADLQNDFNKLKAKREAEQMRLLPARLPLQKSISTPSIIAVRDLAPEPALGGAQPTLPMGRPSGTESETEEEGSRSSNIPHYDINYQQHLHDIPYDRHSEKRRKRGSLFFRKKKDKTKKFSSHQWVSACYGSSHVCDVCAKPLSNKPALYCELCGTTVHQNTCKDNILECVNVKMKGAKSTSKLTGFGVPLSSVKNSGSKRGSGVSNSMSSSTSQILCDDKDSDSHHHEGTNFGDDVALVQSEFLSDTTVTASDLCPDLSLRLHEPEPDSWTPHVGKEIARKLKEKEVKRQEHIYEFILTEKHHCMTLLVMQKIFVEGLQKYFNLGQNLERMFPRLADLTDLHLAFLSKLRQRQKENPVVSSIADILLELFSKDYAVKLKSAYGEFCSRHRDAVDIYKYYVQQDPRFNEFVRHCQTNPLLKKKGIPECILFVTQRLTKYPLLIEPLIKTSKDNKREQEILQRALTLVKEILHEVDGQVAEKEKEDRKLDIYHRIDAKSFTIHRGHKFKKSDILQGNRSLRFEGVAMLMQGRGKMQVVLVIVLTDVLFFLQESNNKYSFFTPDNKAGVVSLQKLLVREKAGQESRGIYLISSNPTEPEMFELKVHKPKDKQTWIKAIREAVQACPEEEEDPSNLTGEDRQGGMSNAKQNQVRNLLVLLRRNDLEQALLLEEKMSLQLRLLAESGLEPPSPPAYRHLVSEGADTGQMWREVLTAVQEVSQLASSLYTTGTNLSRSVSSAGEHQSDAYVSPILPKRAETFGGFDNNQQPPLKLIGKKLHQQNTAGGAATPPSAVGTPDIETLKPGDSRLFERLPYRNCVITGKPGLINGSVSVNIEQQGGAVRPPSQQQLTAPPDAPALLSLGREQQYAAIQLSHYVYTLLCIISQLMTTNGSLQAQMVNLRGGDKQYRHNQQLEELRNLQDKLSVEKASWAATKEQEEKEMEEKRQELVRLQEQIRAEQNDITQQREQLYRKMEVLTSQGLLISPNTTIPVTGPLEDNSSEDSSPQSSSDTTTSSAASTTIGGGANNNNNNSNQTSSSTSSLTYSASTVDKRKESKWAKGTKQHLPINLISTTNQQKVSTNLPIKQQIPLKLASRLSCGTDSPKSQGPAGPHQILPLKLSQDEKIRRTSTSGYQRLSENSFSPPSEETTPTTTSHTRTGSSPAMMQQSPPGGGCSSQSPPGSGGKAVRTNTYPKFPEKFKVRGDQQPPPQEEEVIYF
ncbi:rho guanine nucleotide exchange factor 18 isoform X2 [Anthonomus grandis grandis]|uniref:rho guanine nucleotide exchange factor 18 isoform X2 n=1 Tax=Anthonomus grandis grandis TaxID=2921223 RepID=UPI0021659CB6|nr:rho guanine nucleotide exchange factor 18 isoform X2 [Anthonomus grandis grandis]